MQTKVLYAMEKDNNCINESPLCSYLGHTDICIVGMGAIVFCIFCDSSFVVCLEYLAWRVECNHFIVMWLSDHHMPIVL